MDFDRNDPEIFENAVASLVDMASILFAYQIGVNGFGIGMGMLYAAFDAFAVVWMRKPISRFVRMINPYRLAKKSQPSAPLVKGPEPTEAETALVVAPPLQAEI